MITQNTDSHAGSGVNANFSILFLEVILIWVFRRNNILIARKIKENQFPGSTPLINCNFSSRGHRNKILRISEILS
jgi:hypothetical protein